MPVPVHHYPDHVSDISNLHCNIDPVFHIQKLEYMNPELFEPWEGKTLVVEFLWEKQLDFFVYSLRCVISYGWHLFFRNSLSVYLHSVITSHIVVSIVSGRVGHFHPIFKFPPYASLKRSFFSLQQLCLAAL